MVHHTHCDFHLGDNLVHLHFLRKQAIANPADSFRHYVHDCHLEQLGEAVEDLPSVTLHSLGERPENSINAWKNDQGYFQGSDHKNDFSLFHLAWFDHLGRQMGLGPVFHRATDLLFDYPAIQQPVGRRLPSGLRERVVDILFINSQPCSGQCLAYDDINYFDPLIEELSRKHSIVVTQPSQVPNITCTKETEMTVTEIGSLSLLCRYIIGVATGPIWPTFNIWNQNTIGARFVMLGNGERLNLGAQVVQVDNREAMRIALLGAGLL